jgi:hypothetical protein
MKKFAKVVILFGFTLAVASSTSFAQITFTIDEFGGTNHSNLPSFIGPDPSGGITTSPVLIYTLPFGVLQGDVTLQEYGVTVEYSDVVRFWNPAGINQSEIIFYSDFSATDPADSPADVGLPGQLLSLHVNIPESNSIVTMPEVNDGAIYVAGPGMPGSISAGPIQYNIISDVPEPSSVALLLGGVGLLFGIRRFRR